MFKCLLTFHQVSESFLDSVYTFGDQNEPLDLCLANSVCDSTAALPEQKLIRLPLRGRSGRNIRISYLLRSIENDGNTEEGHWPWQIRQTALYHTFDLQNGRSFWLTLKGNDLLQERVRKSSNGLDLDLPVPVKDVDQDANAYFEAALAIHLIYFAWCDENWRLFINDVEEAVRGILNHAREARIDDHLSHQGPNLATFPKSIQYSHSHQSNSKKNFQRATINPSTSASSVWCYVRLSLIRKLRRRGSQSAKDLEKAPGSHGPQVKPTWKRSLHIDTKEVLDAFRFKDLQTLHTFQERVQKASLTIKLSIKTLQEINCHYGKMRSQPEVFKSFKPGYERAIDDFSSQLQLVLHRLQIRLEQLEFLALQITQGNALYESILQYRTLHVGQIFAEAAQDIAKKTGKETTSMHVITVVTLIFLPATFVASFFQSGVLLWNDNVSPDMTKPYELEGDVLKLFVWVCVPLMLLTLGAWACAWLRVKNRGIDMNAYSL